MLTVTCKGEHHNAVLQAQFTELFAGKPYALFHLQNSRKMRGCLFQNRDRQFYITKQKQDKR